MLGKNGKNSVWSSGPYWVPPDAPLSPNEWVLLKPSDRLWVKRENEAGTRGTVDVIALDCSIFWVWLDGGRGRVALHKDDNVSVWFEEEPT